MHETNTLGSRIQEGRKAAGLSQEALGERLGVSRQAVSKWESDTAIPELENLIAMSRIFGVSVGALLGVEPPAEEAREAEKAAAAPPEELTARELAALEAIAARYAGAQPPRRSGRRRVLALLGCAAAIAGLALAALRLSSLDQQLQTLQNQLNSVQYKMDSQIGVISSQISNILDEKNNIFSDSAVTLTGYSWEEQTVSLSVSAVPREWTALTTAQFTAALSDGRTFSVEGILSDGRFVAEGWAVPMDETITVSATLTDGEANRTGTVDTLYDCTAGSFLPLMHASLGGSWSSNSDTVHLEDLSVYIAPGSFPFELTTAEVRIYRNGAAEPEQVLPIPEAAELWQTAGILEMSSMTGYETAVTLAPGDRIDIQLWAADSQGTWFSCAMDGFSANEYGTVTSTDSGWGEVSVR